MFSDKFGSRRCILIGCTIAGVSIITIPFMPTIPTLIALMLFKSLGSSLWNVSAWSFMSTIGENIHKEGEIVGSYAALAKIGAFISFIVSGVVVMTVGYHTYFIIMGLLVLLAVASSTLFLFSKNQVAANST